MYLYSWVLNNNKTFYACAPLFSGANHIIFITFYLYLINICIITKIIFSSILIMFFELTASVWVELMTHLLGLYSPKIELTILRCLDRGPEHSRPIHKPPQARAELV